MGGAERAHGGVDARDAGNEKIGLGEVEPPAEDERRDRTRGVGVAHARRHHAEAVVRARDLGIGLREAGQGELLGQRLAVEPRFRLAAEHRDDQNPRRGRRAVCGRRPRKGCDNAARRRGRTSAKPWRAPWATSANWRETVKSLNAFRHGLTEPVSPRPAEFHVRNPHLKSFRRPLGKTARKRYEGRPGLAARCDPE